MSQKLKAAIYSLFFLFLMVGFSQTVSAKAVNYKTYKYGTTQTSMADGYYARPAEVKASGNRYLVTMTIRTKKSLSPYPVKVLTINGNAPINVEKVRHGTDYDYRYSFYAKNLNSVVSSRIKIDVPKVYSATHDISFKFDTSNLPKLGSKAATKKETKTAKTTVQTKKSKTDKTINPKNTDNDSDSNNENAALLDQAKTQSSKTKKAQDELAAEKLKQNQQNLADNQRNQRYFYYTIAGGVLCTIVLIVAAVFFVLSAKNRKSRK